MKKDWLWWKHGVIYQVYPRSFYDSNGDGVGDINGIIEKLDYVEKLGVDALWISPINASPMADHGYDVKDYREIAPVFGIAEDFDRLIEEAHKRKLRVILDMVLNHTSQCHMWFLESRSSRKNPKRDWYIWEDGKNGELPNNWKGAFGGSAWEWDEATGQYYMHSFLKEQPDINWRNKNLQKAVFDDLKYWMDKGVDGFRLDVANWYIKDKKLRNNPYHLGYSPRPYDMQKHLYDRNRPETHKILRKFRKILDQYDEKMMVGEIFSPPPGDQELAASYMGEGNDELHLSFDFSLMYRKWRADIFYKELTSWYSFIPDEGWPCHVLSNHDQPRSISRFGRGKNLVPRAKVAAAFLLTIKGTPFLYYGEEIGMENGKIKRRDMVDPLGRRYWPFFKGRDGARTPMQWDNSPYSGFSRANPWLPVQKTYVKNNVESQKKYKKSLLNFYINLIKLRKSRAALYRGSWHPLNRGEDNLLVYYRKYEKSKIYIFLNFSGKTREFEMQEELSGKIILSTDRKNNTKIKEISIKLNPYEITIIE